MTTNQRPCPYTVGKRICIAGPAGHAGAHDWPKVKTFKGVTAYWAESMQTWVTIPGREQGR